MLGLLMAFLILAVAIPGPVQGYEERDAAAHARTPPTVTRDSKIEPSPMQRAARIFFSDRKLVTQRGEEVAFYSDVLRDKVVLINFIFTQCTDSCPTQTARVAEVQSLLGERVGHGVSLVSISVDPEHDTPQALRDYAARFGAGDGWVFLTGSKADVDDVLRRLAQLTPTRESHSTLFILGNVTTGHWIKVHPDAAPAEIARQVRLLAAETTDGPRAELR
jgi:cytochrome oxidase Cu insertion factor (SCO1/SenC/PrrC family)